MKKKLINITCLLLVFFFVSCEENEIMPNYTKVGTSTSTIVTVSLSNDEPLPSEMVEVTVSYVNPSVDPLQSVILMVRSGNGEFVELESWNVTSETKDQLITHSLNYQAPDTPDTSVAFEVIISSGKDFGQRKRTSFTVKEPEEEEGG